MRHAPLGLLVFALLLAPVATAEEEETGTPLEQALANPPATGLLVVGVVPDSQAEDSGIEAGDVIVGYDGQETPDVDALRTAIQGAGAKTSVAMKVVRAGGVEKTFTLAPGRIGVNLAAVTKGEAVAPLPAATGVAFDFSSLKESPHDDWYAFRLVGLEGKRGFEHGTVKLEGDHVVVRREVAFDGGDQFGVNHFVVTVTLTAEATPKLVSWRFKAPLGDYVGEGKVVADESGARRVHFTAGEAEPAVAEIPDDLPVLPSYVVETLAGFLPREAGACFHFRPITDGSGALGLHSALVAMGEGSVEIDGESVTVWKIEQRTVGGGQALGYWVDEKSRVVRSDYGGAVATRATKEEALKDLHHGLQPRTAD